MATKFFLVYTAFIQGLQIGGERKEIVISSFDFLMVTSKMVKYSLSLLLLSSATGANNHYSDQLQTMFSQGIVPLSQQLLRLLWQFVHQAKVSRENSFNTSGLEWS